MRTKCGPPARAHCLQVRQNNPAAGRAGPVHAVLGCTPSLCALAGKPPSHAEARLHQPAGGKRSPRLQRPEGRRPQTGVQAGTCGCGNCHLRSKSRATARHSAFGVGALGEISQENHSFGTQLVVVCMK